MSCGASAGLAAAFNAPLAGVLFPLEEVHKNFSLDVLLPAMASSITADFLSRNLFGMSPVFDFTGVSMLPLRHYWLVLLLGILLGLFGALYNWCTAKARNLFDKIRVPYIKTALPFLAAGLLGFVYPAALGVGTASSAKRAAAWLSQALASSFAGAALLFLFLASVPARRAGFFCPCWCSAGYRAVCSARRRRLPACRFPWRIL